MDKKTKIRKLLRQVPDDQKEYFEKNYDYLLDLSEPIRLFLNKEINTNIFEKTKETTFEDQNWSYKQAFINGQIQAYKQILDLITREDNE